MGRRRRRNSTTHGHMLCLLSKHYDFINSCKTAPFDRVIMWTQFWQTSQQAANAWRTSPPRAAAPVRTLIQQSQPLPLQSAASHGQAGVPSIDVSRAALATPYTTASQSSRRAPPSARSAAGPLSFRSGEVSARTFSQQASLPFRWRLR
jgi:hypothetical protein